MGKQFLDQYSFLHYAVGVVSYFWGLSFWFSIIVHTLFEWIENTSYGIEFINKTLAGIWPGGKPAPDSMINRVGDTLTFAIGWYAAKWVDDFGKAREWY